MTVRRIAAGGPLKIEKRHGRRLAVSLTIIFHRSPLSTTDTSSNGNPKSAATPRTIRSTVLASIHHGDEVYEIVLATIRLGLGLSVVSSRRGHRT